MSHLISSLKSMAKWLSKEFSTIRAMSFRAQKAVIINAIKNHLGASFTCFAILLIAGGCVLLPTKGRIIIIGPEMQTGLMLLDNTPTGKALIQKARRSTRGSPIFLTLGNTTKNDLVDKQGNTVIGVTRTYFKNIANHFVSNGVFVTSNKDILTRPDLIALNIAFELENVIYAMKNPGIEFADDSPFAWETLEQVACELGLIRK
jgi:hypothetical protein